MFGGQRRERGMFNWPQSSIVERRDLRIGGWYPRQEVYVLHLGMVRQ